MINQPDMVVAILSELDRQQPGILCNPALFALICRAADEIIAAVTARPSKPPAPQAVA